jgi:hypothetical protein
MALNAMGIEQCSEKLSNCLFSGCQQAALCLVISEMKTLEDNRRRRTFNVVSIGFSAQLNVMNILAIV